MDRFIRLSDIRPQVNTVESATKLAENIWRGAHDGDQSTYFSAMTVLSAAFLDARDELARLRSALDRANAGFEKHERLWYLATDEAEQLRAKLATAERERDELVPLASLLAELKDEVLDASQLPPSWRATIATRIEFALDAAQAWRTKGDASK